MRGVGSQICDYVPLRNCRLWENKTEGPWRKVGGTLNLPAFTTTRHVCLGGSLARPCTISVGVLVTPSESLTRRGCQDSGTASDSGGVDT
jgi:hypothetical protein